MSSINLIFDEHSIKDKLYTFDSPNRTILKDDYFTQSAVLFTLIPHEDKPYELVLIRRTNTGKRHRGQMAFPGGKFDQELDKTLRDTVLRETYEEIGVPKNAIKLIGCLHDYPTITKFIISPFVGVISSDQELKRQESEVQQIIKVPIDFFVKKTNFKERKMVFGRNYFPVYYFNYKSDTNSYMIWGATAFMIVSFISIVYDYEISELGSQGFRVSQIKNFRDYILNENYGTYLQKFNQK
ncbi:MAG: NUDIX hydrolase [Promethearchaeota archaeon]